MENNYFVIHNSDGDTSVEQITKFELVNRINGNYYGSDVIYLNEIPVNSDTNYWGDAVLIIKGDIITPTPINVVKEYVIE